ncbi:MAG: pyridoxal phosphate-dependent aminotransferase [Anaerolineae bacterium]|nr:pyridoxal phosphate-dependent aminotransferase [Anaerolineae bacterium]
MRISQLGRAVKPSPTLGLNDQAQKMKSRGEPVINLGIGEPKNKAPIASILSSAAKLIEGDLKYVPTDGTPSLKKAIIRYTEENYEKLVAPENVIVSNGAKQSLFNALFSIIDPQDEVILLAPYWVSYPEMIRMAHGIPVVVKPPDGTFQQRIEDVEEAFSSYTRAIIVNSPNNPSGVVYPEAFIAALVDLCERRGIFLIMDDIYHKLVFNGCKATPAYRYATQDIENSQIVVINGVSKLYGLTGVRIGWAIANRQLVETMANIQVQTTSCPPAITQAAAEGALTGVQSVVEALRLTIQNNREITLQELSLMTGIHTQPPDGTFYCLPDFRAYSNNSLELARFLLEKALVAAVPGEPFGMEGHLRISFSGTAKDLIEGIRRIRWALDPNAPNEIYIGDRRMVRDWL